MGRYSAVLILGESLFHHWGARSFDWAERELPSCRGGPRDQRWRNGVWSGMECSGWDVGFEHSLKVRMGSSPCCSVGKHQGLEDDASFDWKPVECAEEWGDMGEIRKVEHQVY